MSKLRNLLLIIIGSLFIVTDVYATSSKFEPTLSMDNYITENQMTVILGYKGEDLMVVKHQLSYDSEYLEFASIGALDNFEVNVSEEVKDGKWRTLTILADSDFAFKETNYAVVVFNVKNKFKKGAQSKIYGYKYEGAGVEKYKYVHNGKILIIDRDTPSEVIYRSEDITKATQIEFWCKDHWYVFVIGALLIAGLVAFIILVPGKRIKESRAQKIRDEKMNPVNTFAVDPIKVDPNAISKIGEEEKVVDMTEAIVINENLKPFNNLDAPKMEETILAPQINTQIDTSVDAFSMKVATDQPVEQVKAEQPVQQQATQPVAQEPVVAPVQPVVQEPVVALVQPVVQEPVVAPVQPVVQEPVVQSDTMTQAFAAQPTQLVDDLQNQPSKNEENLTQFQPTFFGDVSDENK